MKFFKLLALVCLMFAMFVQDVIAKATKQATPTLKKEVKKAAKTTGKKAVKAPVEDD